MTTYKSFGARADIEAILVGRDAVRTDVPVLQPADAFLDTAGEELRRRIFLTQNETGQAMCLRPEFTIPVCRLHVDQNANATRYGYVGTVFRQRQNGASEFLQAGIEDIGHNDVMAADARSLADASACLTALNAVAKIETLLGDQAVFDAVLKALGMPSGWRLQLTHAFGDDSALNAALKKLAQPTKMPNLPDDLRTALEQGDQAEAEALVQNHLVDASLANAGGRSAAEIATRLMAQLQVSKSAPDAGKLQTLRQFLSLRVPLNQAAAKLEIFQADNGLDITNAVADFAKRNAALTAAGLDLATITYDASFGRPLDYYSGLVYELRTTQGAVLAGGGRYDRLLSLLGAATPINGVGFSLWLDRIAEVQS